MRQFRLGLGQINPSVGDLENNTKKILSFIRAARASQVDLIAFPELALTGYPPEDLLLKPQFLKDTVDRLQEIAKASQGIGVVLGFVEPKADIYNAAAILWDGKLAGTYHKTFLPNYGVFDENRYFQEGNEWPVWTIAGITVGVNICEDIWYPTGPHAAQVNAGAELIVNINASPFHAGKCEFRHKMISTRASDHTVIVAYVNLVGGQDELVFDGGSMVYDEQGKLLAEGKTCEEELIMIDLPIENVFRARLHAPRLRKEKFLYEQPRIPAPRIMVSPASLSPVKRELGVHEPYVHNTIAEIYSALVLGARDYVHKNGFKKVIIGLSGGIDSSLVAAIAVDALGKTNVIGLLMPSRFSSEASHQDATLLAKNLGITAKHIPIHAIHDTYLSTLSEEFTDTEPGTAEENIQARIRGNLLMALSNKFGWLVLTTGNKSEIATGYCTLYGDMAGGFAIIKDVPKTMVYKLSSYRNARAGREIIPRSVFEKAPTAELRPDQKDTDTLPPYDLLDPLLEAYVEEDRDIRQILAMGFDKEIARKVMEMVDKNEYKRRQAAPGIKITPRAFGKDRRLPITNRYRSL
ncbi:MAG: NAD+ synthase [Chloroflexi bacterium]|nr:NAD+ synthase [Chloroflexota bacterium]MBI4329993.1 NAD+ synthase [Chloroflexota bacterium]